MSLFLSESNRLTLKRSFYFKFTTNEKTRSEVVPLNLWECGILLNTAWLYFKLWFFWSQFRLLWITAQMSGQGEKALQQPKSMKAPAGLSLFFFSPQWKKKTFDMTSLCWGALSVWCTKRTDSERRCDLMEKTLWLQGITHMSLSYILFKWRSLLLRARLSMCVFDLDCVCNAKCVFVCGGAEWVGVVSWN